MSNALEIARAKRAEMKAAGISADKHITFSGTAKPVESESKAVLAEVSELDLIRKAAQRAGYTSMTDYVKDTVFKQAVADANRPVKPRSSKTPEQLEAEAAKLLERANKLKSN